MTKRSRKILEDIMPQVRLGSSGSGNPSKQYSGYHRNGP